MHRVLAVAAIVLTLVASAGAQAGITGKWQGETPNGAQLLLDLTAKGTNLTGSLTRNKETVSITEGKVSKNTFTFKAVLNDQAEGFSGQVDRDEMKIWLDRQGESNAVVLKRVKSS
jgi:hypothetical protein